jgi:hypothetical protein
MTCCLISAVPRFYMPFTLRIKRVESNGEAALIVGELESGCYFGPEEIAVPLIGGRSLMTVVTTMNATSLKGWPILPEHGSILTLGLNARIKPSDIGIGELAKGRGFSTPAGEMFRDANELLQDPRFWSTHYSEQLVDQETRQEPDELIPHFFGHAATQTDEFFQRYLIKQKAFPRFTKRLPNQSSVEVSYMEGAEFQVRYGICSSAEQPILLGYQSGHFSLPAFRWEEIKQIYQSHLAIAGSRSAAECLLLLFPSIYVCAEDSHDEIHHVVANAWQELGIISTDVDGLTRNIVTSLTVGSHRWTQHPIYGWISNNSNCQRNPDSKLSALPESGWAKISLFFSTI